MIKQTIEEKNGVGWELVTQRKEVGSKYRWVMCEILDKFGFQGLESRSLLDVTLSLSIIDHEHYPIH